MIWYQGLTRLRYTTEDVSDKLEPKRDFFFFLARIFKKPRGTLTSHKSGSRTQRCHPTFVLPPYLISANFLGTRFILTLADPTEGHGAADSSGYIYIYLLSNTEIENY